MGYFTRTTSMQAGASARRKAIAAIFAATLILAGCNNPKTGGTSTPGGGGAKPEKQGPPQKIELVWKKATNSWKVKLNGGNEQDPKNAHTNLARNIVGPTQFEVSVNGGGNTPPSFSGDPLSVWEGQGQKSSPQNGINTTQILGPIMTDHGTLIFWDLNQGPQATLNYQLNFNGAPPVDPIIDNGGHD